MFDTHIKEADIYECAQSVHKFKFERVCAKVNIETGKKIMKYRVYQIS